MLVRTAFLSAILLLASGADTIDESYQQAGQWTITVTPLKLPAAAQGVKGYSKQICRAPLGRDGFPKVGSERQLAPGVTCRVTEISPFDGPYRRVDLCRRADQTAATQITYVGQHSPERYTLEITTEMAGRPDVTVVVREDGERTGPCPGSKP